MKQVTTYDIYKTLKKYYRTDTELLGVMFDSCNNQTKSASKFFYKGSKTTVQVYLESEPKKENIFDVCDGYIKNNKWRQGILNCPDSMRENIFATIERISNKDISNLINEIYALYEACDLTAYISDKPSNKENCSEAIFLLFMYTLCGTIAFKPQNTENDINITETSKTGSTNQTLYYDNSELSLEETVYYIGQKMDSIIGKMESIQEKLNNAISHNDVTWIAVYKKQLAIHSDMQEKIFSLFNEINQHQAHCEKIIKALKRIDSNNTFASNSQEKSKGIDKSKCQLLGKGYGTRQIRITEDGASSLAFEMNTLSKMLNKTRDEFRSIFDYVIIASQEMDELFDKNLLSREKVAFEKYAFTNSWEETINIISSEFEQLSDFLNSKANILYSNNKIKENIEEELTKVSSALL